MEGQWVGQRGSWMCIWKRKETQVLRRRDVLVERIILNAKRSLYAKEWGCRWEPTYVLTGRFKQPNGERNLSGVKWNRKGHLLTGVHPSILHTLSSLALGLTGIAILTATGWRQGQIELCCNEKQPRPVASSCACCWRKGGSQSTQTERPQAQGPNLLAVRRVHLFRGENTGRRDASNNFTWNTGAKRSQVLWRGLWLVALSNCSSRSFAGYQNKSRPALLHGSSWLDRNMVRYIITNAPLMS